MSNRSASPNRLRGRLLATTLLVCVVLTAAHLLAVHQGQRWISPLLIGDHLFDLMFALIILTYSVALGRAVAWPLLGLSDDPLSEQLAAMGLGLGLLSLALLGVGLLHLFYPPVMLGGALALTYALRHELAILLQQAGDGMTGWRRRGMPTAPTQGQRLVLFLLIVALVLIMPRTALPPSYNASAVDLDTVSYHLAAPRVYMAAYGIFPRPDMPLANAPAGGDILNVLGLYAGSDTVGRMFNLLLTVLLGVATYALGRRHFGQASAWLGALLFLGTNWLDPLAPTIIPDFAAAFLLVLGCSDLLDWSRPRLIQPTFTATPSGPRQGRVIADWLITHQHDLLLVRAGLLLGLAASFKLTNLPALPAAVLIAGLVPLLQRQGSAWARLYTAARTGIVLGMFMCIPLAPWLLKNLYFFGTPFYPISVGLNDATTTAATAAASTTATGAGPSAHLAYLWWIISTLGDTSWHYINPLVSLLILAPVVLRKMPGGFAAGLLLAMGALSLLVVPLFLPPRYWLGPIAVSDAVLAAVFCRLEQDLKHPTVRALVGLVVILDVTVWLAAVPLGPLSAFSLFTVIAGELAIAVILLVLQWRQRPGQFWELPIVALLVLSTLVSMFVTMRETVAQRYLAVASGTLSREAYLRQNNWYYPAYAWANQHLPSNSTVVLVNLVAGYYLDRPYLDDWYGARSNALLGGSAARQAEFKEWCHVGVQYVIFDSNLYLYAPRAYRWTSTPGLAARALYSANGVDVLAVSPCAVATSLKRAAPSYPGREESASRARSAIHWISHEAAQPGS